MIDFFLLSLSKEEEGEGGRDEGRGGRGGKSEISKRGRLTLDPTVIGKLVVVVGGGGG